MNFNLMPFTVLLQIGRKVTDTILEAKFESNGCGGINHFLIFQRKECPTTGDSRQPLKNL